MSFINNNNLDNSSNNSNTEFNEDLNLDLNQDESFKSKIYYEIKDYFENVKDKYINEQILINSIEKIFRDIPSGPVNRCLECNIDLTECNPRQLCGKLYCTNT